MTLSTKIIYNVTATAFNIVAGFARNKIFAIYLSITLFGILSLMQQSASLLFTFFALGLPLAFSTISAQQIIEPLEKQKEVISRMILLVLVISLAAGILIAGFIFYDSFEIAHIIVKNKEYATGVTIILFSVPFMIIQNSLFAILEGRGLVKEVVIFKVVPMIIGLPVLFWFVYTYQLRGAAIGLVLNEFLFTITGLYLLRNWFSFKRETSRFYLVIPSVFKIALLSVAIGIGSLGADFVVKRYVLEIFGELENGIIQSVSKITDLYPAIALSWLTVHLFPEVVKNSSDTQKLCRIIERTVLIAVIIVVPIIVILFALRETVLAILYKNDFIIATKYFGAMLAVGIPKVVGWVVGLPLLPMGLKKHWFYSSLIFIISYAMGVWFGVQSGCGITSIPISYGVSLVLQMIYVFWIYHYYQVKFSKDFYGQCVFMALLSVTIICASFNVLFLWLTVVLFFGMIWRYRLIEEIKKRLYDFIKS